MICFSLFKQRQNLISKSLLFWMKFILIQSQISKTKILVFKIQKNIMIRIFVLAISLCTYFSLHLSSLDHLALAQIHEAIFPKLIHAQQNASNTNAKHCEAGYVFVQKHKKCLPVQVICDPHQYFNQKQQKCFAIGTTCQRDERYSRQDKKCVKVDRNCSTGFVFNEKSLSCKKIVNCVADEELSAEWHVCQKKKITCPKGQVLDLTKNVCVARNFITNPYHEKLSYVGDFKNYVSYYNTAKSVDKLLADCPFRTPFYQKSSTSCVSCPKATPIFDLTNDKCIACKYNEIYNSYEHKCMDQKIHFDAPASMWRIGL